jgi:hypothetical protein
VMCDGQSAKTSAGSSDNNLRCPCLRVYIPVNCPACILFTPLEKLLLTARSAGIKLRPASSAQCHPKCTLNNLLKEKR